MVEHTENTNTNTKGTQEITLESVENELAIILDTDRRGWVRMYRLLEIVDNNKLWEQNYDSFSAWLRAYAQAHKINESLLWHRKQAGKFYSQFFNRASAAGADVKTLEQASIASDSLNLAEKISQKNTAVADELINKLIKKELTRQDLSAAWHTVRAEKALEKAQNTASKDNKKACEYNNTDTSKNAASASKIAKIAASDIVFALRSAGWLPESLKEKNSEAEKYAPNFYRALTEFAVRTGDTRNARRIDVMCAENVTVSSFDKAYRLNLHAVEIKVDKHDLLNDHKMTEYGYFADFCWLAVPDTLKDIAFKVLPIGWGLIIIDSNDKSLSVPQCAIKITDADYIINRYTALMTMIIQR